MKCWKINILTNIHNSLTIYCLSIHILSLMTSRSLSSIYKKLKLIFYKRLIKSFINIKNSNLKLIINKLKIRVILN